jgi:hypothetical protein
MKDDLLLFRYFSRSQSWRDCFGRFQLLIRDYFSFSGFAFDDSNSFFLSGPIVLSFND